MPGYVVVQEVPTADQLEAIVLTVFQAGLHNVIATYGPTPHPVSGTGLTIVHQQLFPAVLLPPVN